MAKPAPKRSLVYTLYVLLILGAILFHMLLAGESVGSMLGQIFSEPTGIFAALWTMTVWTVNVIFSAYGAVLLGLVVAMEFIIMPLAMRYKYLTVKPNLVMSVIAAVYFMLIARILAEAFLAL